MMAPNIRKTVQYSLNVLSWNINNIFSSDFGNKLQDGDFLETTQHCDIIGLTETHTTSNDKLEIPGYNKPFLKAQGKIKGKAYGGIAVYVKLISKKTIK